MCVPGLIFVDAVRSGEVEGAVGVEVEAGAELLAEFVVVVESDGIRCLAAD